MNWNLLSRKIHRWGALITFVPLFLVIASGLLLQVKKQVEWVQPPTKKGVQKNEPVLSWEKILEASARVPEAAVTSWDDINRLDVRPGKGIVKVQCENRWELQIDLKTGDLLSSTYRRSDLIESLHDGSFFSDAAKLWVFLPNGLILFVLWGSGAWLWYLPISRKRAKRERPKEVSP